MQSQKVKYITFLRGINVGGHHKVPMEDLRKQLKKLGFENILTLLNSGNIIFDAKPDPLEVIENKISAHLESYFGFPVPTIVRTAETIADLCDNDPFKDFELTKETRFYISLLKNDVTTDLTLPWTSDDGSFTIIEKRNSNVISVLDLSVSKTPKAMEAIEHYFGKDITTRNWNTIGKIGKKI